MATVAENIEILQTKAAELDALITQFRSIKAVIDTAEYEIKKQRFWVGVLSGQERLASYAHSLMVRPSIAGDMTVAQLSAKAWEGVA